MRPSVTQNRLKQSAFRRFSLVAIAVSACALVSAADAQVRQIQCSKAWTKSGSPDAAPSILPVTPSTNPDVAAKTLLARPQGARGLLMNGFADDIAAYDMLVSVPASAPSVAARSISPKVAVPSPWITFGTQTVRNRVERWISRFVAAGGSADLVLFSCNVRLDATRYQTSWNQIGDDPRSAVMKSVLKYRAINSTVAKNPEFISRWNELANDRIDLALTEAASTALVRSFPRAMVALQRTNASDPASANQGWRFGTHDLVAIPNAVPASDGWKALTESMALNRAKLNMARRQTISWIAVPSAGAMDARTKVDACAWWQELNWQLLLSGNASVVCGDGTVSASDSEVVRNALAELSSRVPDVNALRSNRLPADICDPQQFIATAAFTGRDQLVRISARPDINVVRVTLSDGTYSVLPLAIGQHGCWLTIAPTAVIKSISNESSGGTPLARATTAPWITLYDSFPDDRASKVEGTSPYMLVGQYDVDPAIATTGIVDPAKAIARVERMIQAGQGSPWGVLDFEEPFDAIWEAGSADPRYSGAINSLVATIRALKQRYPNIKWTYYGLPRVKYWLPEGEWALISPEQRAARYKQFCDVLSPLMPEMDFFMPGVYDVYERALGMPTTKSPAVEAEAWWRRANVECIASWFQSRSMPVPPIIPMVSPWFQGGGIATLMAAIPSAEFMEEQVRPLVAAGASGIGIWGGMRYALYVAQWPTNHPNPAFMELRAQTRQILAKNCLSTIAPATIDWTSAEILQKVGDALNDVMYRAVVAVRDARP